LGITNCDSNQTAACTHLNVWAIWYAADATKTNSSGSLVFPNFANAITPYINFATGGVNWFWYPEVFVKYPGDSLQVYIGWEIKALEDDHGSRLLTVTAFIPSNDWPEGISQNVATCCNQKNFDTAVPSKLDVGSDPNYVSAYQSFNLLSADKTPDVISYLTSRGLRTMSYLVGK
jgi:hypothetical protein